MRRPPATAESGSTRRNEAAALLAAAHAVLERRTFADAAQAVLTACRAILGAAAGWVAVNAPGSTSFEVVVAQADGLAIGTGTDLPIELRPLVSRVCRSRRTAFTRRLSTPAAADGIHRTLRPPASALVAPILVSGDIAGLFCLLDRPTGFHASEARLAEVFAEMTAVALLNRRTVNGLEKRRNALEREVQAGATQLDLAERTLRTLLENLPDVIARFDRDLRHLYVSPAVERTTGRPAREFIGRNNRELGMPLDLCRQWDDALHRVFAHARPETLEYSFSSAQGIRYFDCRLVPELGSSGAVTSVLSVARDVTDRWMAEQAERHARGVAEALREATAVLTRSLDRETVLVTLLDRLRRIVPFDRASVMLLDQATRLSVRAIFDGESVVPLPAERRPELEAADHPIVQAILRTGNTVLIPDIRTRRDWSLLPTSPPLAASWMGVPMFARGTVAGLFSLFKREVDYFNAEHMRLAEALSSQASIAVENAVLFEQAQASAAQLKALSRRLVEAQEDERRRIARELHDEAGQALVSLRFGLQLLKREIGEGLRVYDRILELMQTVDEVIDGLDRLASDLRPPSLDHLGLEAALRQYARSVTHKLGLTVHFKSRGFPNKRLAREVETALYRVVQEAMTNVVRHAQATRVDLLVEHRGDRVLVMVEDNGVGFVPDRVDPEEHFGLLGIRERAEAVGGTLTLESKPGAGATVVMEVPSADPNPAR